MAAHFDIRKTLPTEYRLTQTFLRLRLPLCAVGNTAENGFLCVLKVVYISYLLSLEWWNRVKADMTNTREIEGETKWD